MIYRRRLFRLRLSPSDEGPTFDHVLADLRAATCAWAGLEQVNEWPAPNAVAAPRALDVEEWIAPDASGGHLVELTFNDTIGGCTWLAHWTLGSVDGQWLVASEECHCESHEDPPAGVEPPDLSEFLARYKVEDLDARSACGVYGVALDAFERVKKLLTASVAERHLPVVIIVRHRHGIHAIDVAGLKYRLRGLAHVLKVEDWPFFPQEFPHPCYPGSVRLYLSGYQPDDAAWEHPFWKTDLVREKPREVADEVVARVLKETRGLDWSDEELEALRKARQEARTTERIRQHVHRLRAEMRESASEEMNAFFEDLVADHQRVSNERDEFEQLWRAADAKARALAFSHEQPPPPEEPVAEEAVGQRIMLSERAAEAYAALDAGIQREMDTKILEKLASEELSASQSEPVKASGGTCYVYPRGSSAGGSRVIYRVEGGMVLVLELYQNHDRYDIARDVGFDLESYGTFTPWRTTSSS